MSFIIGPGYAEVQLDAEKEKREKKKTKTKKTQKQMDITHFRLSYDVAVIQWLTSCHKNRMTTRYITLSYWRVKS